MNQSSLCSLHCYISLKCDNSSLLCWRLQRVWSTSQAQPCYCLRITTGTLIYDYGSTTMSWCWAPSSSGVLLMQALIEGEDSKTKVLGWLKWCWVVVLKCARTLPWVEYLATYWALHGATSLMLFPNADRHVIRNFKLFHLGMDGNNVC